MGKIKVLASFLPQCAGALEIGGGRLLGLLDQGVARVQVFFKAEFSHGVRKGKAICMNPALWRDA